jgi:hypothetical protein
MKITKTTNFLSAIVLLTAAVSSPASAVVMDFETLAFPGFSNQSPQSISATPTTYSEDGFTLITTGVNAGFGFARYGTNSSRFPGSTALLNNTVARDTVLTKNGGGPFSIAAISLATTNALVSGSFDVLFTGTKSDNSTVDQTFSIDNTTYALETFLFSSAFTDLVSLRWTQGSPSHQFDNLVLDEAINAVPAPAGLPLFLAGLLGVGITMRRAKRRSAA